MLTQKQIQKELIKQLKIQIPNLEAVQDSDYTHIACLLGNAINKVDGVIIDIDYIDSQSDSYFQTSYYDNTIQKMIILDTGDYSPEYGYKDLAESIAESNQSAVELSKKLLILKSND